MLTRFILVRHGQTEWNRVERFRGRADLSLDDTGMKQAEAAADSLAGMTVAAIYSSPLKRALQTAGAFSKRLGVPVTPLEGLIDIDYGDWQGLTPGECEIRDKALHDAWHKTPQLVRFPGGESLEVVRTRVTSAVNELTAMHQGNTVVLVSHKVVCQTLLCALLGLDNSHFWRVRQDVCAIIRFDMKDGTATITLMNDTCHLKSAAGRK